MLRPPLLPVPTVPTTAPKCCTRPHTQRQRGHCVGAYAHYAPLWSVAIPITRRR